jgi:threonine/homoserine/homoserine lactone efflux protein
MVPLSHAAAFAVAALLIIVIPGPNVLFAIGRALTLGRRSAVLSVAGAVTGSFVPLVAVSFGLGAALMASAMVFLIVKVAGAAYLIYLGIATIRQRKKLAAALRSKVPGAGGGRVFRALPAQLLILGVIFLAIQALSDGSWALLAATVRSWFVRSPRRLETVGSTGGLMIIGVGAGMALTGTN